MIEERVISEEYRAFLEAVRKVNGKLAAYIEDRVTSDNFHNFLDVMRKANPAVYDILMQIQEDKKLSRNVEIIRCSVITKTLLNNYSPDQGYRSEGILKDVFIHLKGDAHEGINKQRVELEDKIALDYGGIRKHTFSFNDRVFTAKLTDSAIKDLSKLDIIEKIEKSGKARILQQAIGWGYKAINAQVPYHAGIKGKNVKVCVLDTGVDFSHEELSDRYKGGYNFVSGGAPMDDHGHGTAVSGVLCATDNDRGLIGVAPEIDLYACKVLDVYGSGYWTDIAAGVDWCVQNGIHVINMSFGGTYLPGTAVMEAACANAWAKGLVLVAAAGNSGFFGVTFPASYECVIAVSAIDENLNLASFSSYGPQVEVTAPGVNIYTCWRLGDIAHPTGYDNPNGTSFASPFVAGLAALIKAWHPEATNQEIRNLIKNNAKDL